MRLIKEILKITLPKRVLDMIKYRSYSKKLNMIKSYGKLNESEVKDILLNKLKLQEKDDIFVHSSLDFLHINFSPNYLLDLILEIIGPEGNLVMPTFSGLSHDLLKSEKIFKVRRTPSQSGLLTELLRRKSGSLRSIHPTKSVVGIGPKCKEILSEHHLSSYPFGEKSPFYKLIKKDFKIIGLGVSTSKLSIVHCCEDELGSNFPVKVNVQKKFNSICINYDGKEVLVKTYAHNMFRMNHNIPKYIFNHYSKKVDFRYKGRDLFLLQSRDFYSNLKLNAKKRITIYPRYSYKFGDMFKL